MSEQNRNTDAAIKIYVTNLGKYNEGSLVGQWMDLPTTPEIFANALKAIAIDGKRYEEYFITDYESTIDNLFSGISAAKMEYANIEELNYLAAKVEEMPQYEVEKFEAALESGEYANTVADMINLASGNNLDCYQFLEGVHTDEDLGYYWVEESGAYDLKAMGNLAQYIDYERFGRDIRLEESGVFADSGYIVNADGFEEIYTGIDDIPGAYRLNPSNREEIGHILPEGRSMGEQIKPSPGDKTDVLKEKIQASQKPSVLGQIKDFQEQIKNEAKTLPQQTQSKQSPTLGD